jgi:hypothetical protein
MDGVRPRSERQKGIYRVVILFAMAKYSNETFLERQLDRRAEQTGHFLIGLFHIPCRYIKPENRDLGVAAVAHCAVPMNLVGRSQIFQRRCTYVLPPHVEPVWKGSARWAGARFWRSNMARSGLCQSFLPCCIRPDSLVAGPVAQIHFVCVDQRVDFHCFDGASQPRSERHHRQAASDGDSTVSRNSLDFDLDSGDNATAIAGARAALPTGSFLGVRNGEAADYLGVAAGRLAASEVAAHGWRQSALALLATCLALPARGRWPSFVCSQRLKLAAKLSFFAARALATA